MAQQDSHPNLTSRGVRFKKGVSGNPSGVASRMDKLVTIALRERLATYDQAKRKTFAEQVADRLLDCVLDPDPELDKTVIMAISEIIDRAEGKPKQQLEVNDAMTELRLRSDEDLMFWTEHHYWPEDEYREKRKQKLLEANAKFDAVKPDTNTTQ